MMDEIHKKIEDYVKNAEGPFFCIMIGEGDRIEVCKDITLEELTLNCLEGIWEMQKTRKNDVAAYAGFLFIYVLAFAKKTAWLSGTPRCTSSRTVTPPTPRRKQSFNKE